MNVSWTSISAGYLCNGQERLRIALGIVTIVSNAVHDNRGTLQRRTHDVHCTSGGWLLLIECDIFNLQLADIQT